VLLGLNGPPAFEFNLAVVVSLPLNRDECSD
jgi:hypothetical protein